MSRSDASLELMLKRHRTPDRGGATMYGDDYAMLEFATRWYGYGGGEDSDR
jgi:hypothetical protein